MTQELLNTGSIISDLDSCLTSLELLFRRQITAFGISSSDVCSKLELYRKSQNFDKKTFRLDLQDL